MSISVKTLDGVAVANNMVSLAWNVPEEPQGLNGQVLALGGGGLLVLVAVISLVLLRRREDVEVEVHDQPAATQGHQLPLRGQLQP